MPLPPALLQAWSQATLTPQPIVDEGWVLAVTPPPGSPPLKKVGPATAEELGRRLDQMGVTWSPLTLRAGDWESPGVLVEGLTRARAVRIAHKLRRWALLRVTPRGTQVLYTGINDRAR